MEKRRSFFDYMGQTLSVFGTSIVVLNILCLVVGEEAQSISTLYSLGNKGISVTTAIQFLGVSGCITWFRFLFFTDEIIRRMSGIMRMACMFGAVIILVAVCAVIFGWFPVYMWQAWAGFLLSFTFCTGVSMTAMALKEKTENRKMEEALQRIKEEQKNKTKV